MTSDSSLQELLKSAVPFALPLRRRFRGLDQREGMLIRGPSGWGEFAPFDDYSDAAAAKWLTSAIEAAYGPWPEPRRPSIPISAIIPAVPSDDAAQLAREALLTTGCSTVKIKVAEPNQTLADDEARVASVRDVLDTVLGRGQGRIRLDANGAWSIDQARSALRRLGAYGIEYVEQPCETVADTRTLRSDVEIPIAVDELIRRSDDPMTLDLHDVADIAIIKVAPLGGVKRALAIAEHVGIPVVVSGALDSSVGLVAGLTLAGQLDEVPYACGLGTGLLLAADVVDEPTVPVNGEIPVTRTSPDLPALLAARDALGDERAAWWRGRLSRAWAHVSDDVIKLIA